jgi:hypothetical protein
MIYTSPNHSLHRTPPRLECPVTSSEACQAARLRRGRTWGGAGEFKKRGAFN